MNEQNVDSQNEISLIDLVNIIRRNIILILAFTIFAAMAAGLYAFFVASETYASNADVMVQVQVDAAVEGSYDYSTAQKLLTTIAEYMAKDVVLQEVIDELSLDKTTGQLRSNLTIKSSLTSYFISIKYIDKDPVLSKEIVNSIIDNAIQIANNNSAFPTLKDKITRTSFAKDGIYESPNKPLYLVIGIILGGIIGVGFVFLKEFLNNSFKTKEQLEAAFNIQVLGIIPEFEVKENF